jgi:hypothetical protein
MFPLVAIVGCVDPLTAGATNTPEWELKNAKGYAETVAGSAPDTAYGWSFAFDGDAAHWFECAAPNMCGEVRRERPRGEVVAVEKVGHATVGDGGVVEVVKLSLAPGRKYVVPYDRPGSRAGR